MKSVLLLATSAILLALGDANDEETQCFRAASDEGDWKTKMCLNTTSSRIYLEPAENPDDNVYFDLDTMYLIIMGALVFFMQTGFAMLEAGAVHLKNIQNILYKNLMDASIGCIIFYLIGFGFAYGNDDDNPFIGSGNFALSEPYDGIYRDWFFQYAFAATAATIVSGSVAERCKLDAYFIYATALTAWVYPVVVHWVWDEQGWLHNISDNGLIDFAGSGVVHLVGGTAGLVGAAILGPRWDTFDPKTGEPTPKEVAPQETLLQSLGTTFLWFGWYGFNCGSTLGIVGASATAARVAIVTTLSAATAGISSALLSRILYAHHNLGAIFNGILTGLVACCASVATIEVYMAIPIGVLAAIVYNSFSRLLLWMKIDDPLDAAAVHGGGGMLGLLCAGIFSSPRLIDDVFTNGADYTSGKQFGIQLLGVVVIISWTAVNSLIFFGIMSKTIGMRVDLNVEKLGLDRSEHGGMTLVEMSGNFRNSKLNLLGNLGLAGAVGAKKKYAPPTSVIPEIREEDESELKDLEPVQKDGRDSDIEDSD